MKKIKFYVGAALIVIAAGALTSQESFAQATGGPVETFVEWEENGENHVTCMGTPRDCWTGTIIKQ